MKKLFSLVLAGQIILITGCPFGQVETTSWEGLNAPGQGEIGFWVDSHYESHVAYSVWTLETGDWNPIYSDPANQMPYMLITGQHNNWEPNASLWVKIRGRMVGSGRQICSPSDFFPGDPEVSTIGNITVLPNLPNYNVRCAEDDDVYPPEHVIIVNYDSSYL